MTPQFKTRKLLMLDMWIQLAILSYTNIPMMMEQGSELVCPWFW